MSLFFVAGAVLVVAVVTVVAVKFYIWLAATYPVALIVAVVAVVAVWVYAWYGDYKRRRRLY